MSETVAQIIAAIIAIPLTVLIIVFCWAVVVFGIEKLFDLIDRWH